jgi:NAD(P)H-hydrate epimerase
MRAVDFDATARFGIAAHELMDNAGRLVAEYTSEYLKKKNISVGDARIIIICGRGANGGDGLVAARYLKMAGASVWAYVCPPKKDADYPELVRVNREAAIKAGVTIRLVGPESGLREALGQCDIVIDALLGTGSAGKPAGAIHHAVQEMTRAKKPVIAIDIPTGLHPDTGHHSGVYVTADVTLALGLPKKGLLAPHARQFIGELKVLDIGYPPELIHAVKSA